MSLVFYLCLIIALSEKHVTMMEPPQPKQYDIALSAVVANPESKDKTPASIYHKDTSLRHFCCPAIISAAIRPIKITRRLLESFTSGFR
jgi:hypothetical protein